MVAYSCPIVRFEDIYALKLIVLLGSDFRWNAGGYKSSWQHAQAKGRAIIVFFLSKLFVVKALRQANSDCGEFCLRLSIGIDCVLLL